MIDRKKQDDVTLLDVLIDGFEKNDVLRGFHWRALPISEEAAAVRKFTAFADEARRLKGTPVRAEESSARRVVAWPDLEIRQAGRAVMVRVKAPSFNDWWNEPRTWRDNPMREIFEWLEEETV